MTDVSVTEEAPLADGNMTLMYDSIATEIIARASVSVNDTTKKQLFIGIVGPPGSGKSTLSKAVSERVPKSIVVPMDGYHYYKRELEKFEDPELAFARRGSHWTFNSQKMAVDLEHLKRTGEGRFPSFDHGVGDPVEGDILVTADVEVVIIEGNYLLLPQDPWLQIKKMLEFSYFIQCDIDTLAQRVIKRHMLTGVGREEHVARARWRDNDMPNALEILQHAQYADSVISSL